MRGMLYGAVLFDQPIGWDLATVRAAPEQHQKNPLNPSHQHHHHQKRRSSPQTRQTPRFKETTRSSRGQSRAGSASIIESKCCLCPVVTPRVEAVGKGLYAGRELAMCVERLSSLSTRFICKIRHSNG
jgi:hypothetical protein